MPPKSQRAAGSRAKSATGLDEEFREPFPAIVLADAFETRFTPFTLEKPRCLLPLGNIPIIEYTLEFLANAGIDEVYLYAGKHSDQVEAYIAKSRWKAASSPFKVVNFIRSQSTSIGDIMRDLHSKRLIESDFVAVYGDVVGNFSLDKALKEHRARRATDKNAIMTMVLREVSVTHRSRPLSTIPIFCIDPTNNRCLHYEEMETKPGRNQPRRLLLDPEVVDNQAELDIRGDLIDTSIDICTPEVLGLWSDSFDYQTPRTQFLYGVLKDYELNGKTIHTHIIKDTYYSARMQSLKAYDAISKDIISRYTFPFCPDTNLIPGNAYYLSRRNTYLEDPIARSVDSDIERRTIVGSGTSIGEKVKISNSVVGRRCKIGKNVTLDNAYVWDDTVIGDNTTVRHAIIANNVVIGSSCTIEPGALISFGVKVGAGITVAEGRRIVHASLKSGVTVSNEKSLVGSDGEGCEYSHEDDSDYDDSDNESETSSALMESMADLHLSDDSISTLATDDESDLDGGVFGPSSVDDAYLSEDDHPNFVYDAVASMYDGIRIGQPYDMVQTELVSLRMSANASEHETRKAVVTAFMKSIHHLMLVDKVPASAAVSKILGNYHKIIERVVFDKRTAQKPDQVDFLLLIQMDLSERERGEIILPFVSKELYMSDAIDQEAFEQWWADERSTATEALRKVRAQTKQFIEWLAESESESESEEEDSD
ncbi:Translation initiation factor eIF-2B subunit epsilon [Ascosphaera aggregata]|nr:Translation initiation factor eIF-2B subunit epsilon [Ascosphaera aggregata]